MREPAHRERLRWRHEPAPATAEETILRGGMPHMHGMSPPITPAEITQAHRRMLSIFLIPLRRTTRA